MPACVQTHLWSFPALTIGLAMCVSANGEPINRDRIGVVDADTIYARGQDKNTRLIGFNAPETGRRAQCEHERNLGDIARTRLLQLLDEGSLDLTFIRCACSPGTEGTMSCNYARTCGILTVNGVDAGKTLIAEELAVPFVCGETRCPPTPRPWCAGQ